MAYGMPNALPRPAFPDEHRLQFSDTLSINRGRHTIKAGADLNRIHELLINLFQGGGVYSYSGATAFTNWAADVYWRQSGRWPHGPALQHLRTGHRSSVTGVGKDDFYDTDFAGFVEDSLKPRVPISP